MNTTPRRAVAVAAGAFTTLAVVASTLLGGMAAAADVADQPEAPAMTEIIAPADQIVEETPEIVAPEQNAVLGEQVELVPDIPSPDAGPEDATDVTVNVLLTNLGAPVVGHYVVRTLDGQQVAVGYSYADGHTDPVLVAPGTYLVYGAAQDYITFGEEYYGGKPGTDLATPVELIAGEDRNLIIDLDRRTTLLGSVTNLDGTIPVGHSVHKLAPDLTDLGHVDVIWANSNLSAFPGDYVLSVVDPDGVTLGYWDGTTVLSATPEVFTVSELGTDVEFRIVLGSVAGEEPSRCIDPATGASIPCEEEPEHCEGEYDGSEYDCEPDPEHCDGEYDGSEYDCQDPTEECDPTRENCGDPNEECDPMTEECDPGHEECDPAVERCHDWNEECDDSTEECDEHETETHTETELETLALTGAPIAAIALTASALLLGGLVVLAARRRETA